MDQCGLVPAGTTFGGRNMHAREYDDDEDPNRVA